MLKKLRRGLLMRRATKELLHFAWQGSACSAIFSNCTAQIIRVQKNLEGASKGASANSRAEKEKGEHHDQTQGARRGSSAIDNFDNACTCTRSNLRTRRVPGNESGSGCAEWRCIDSCRQNGTGVTWRCRQFLCAKHCLCENGPRGFRVGRSGKITALDLTSPVSPVRRGWPTASP